jgi:hypothetical protein
LRRLSDREIWWYVLAQSLNLVIPSSIRVS